MNERMQSRPNELTSADRYGKLTYREQQVATLVSEGFSNKLIARSPNVSEGAIKCHVHTVFQKLGVKSRYGLLVALGRIKSG